MTSAVVNDLRTAVNAFVWRMEAYHSYTAFEDGRLDDDLSILLGCPYYKVYPNYLANDDQAADDVVMERRALYPKVMRALGADPAEPSDATCLLIGLHRHSAWKVFLESEDDSYLLAGVIIDFLDRYWHEFKLDELAAKPVMDILNTWIKPIPSWLDLPTVHEICRHLFGELWCTLALPEDEGNRLDARGLPKPYAVVRALMLDQRPPFLDGLCYGQTEVTAAQLPDLGGSAMDLIS